MNASPSARSSTSQRSHFGFISSAMPQSFLVARVDGNPVAATHPRRHEALARALEHARTA